MIIYSIRLTIYFLLFFLPFIFYPTLADPFEFPKTVFFIATIMFAIGLFGLAIITQEIKKIKLDRLHLLLVLFLLSQAASSILGTDFQQSLFGQYYRYQGLITQICYFGFFFLISQLDSLKISSNKLFLVIALSGAVSALLVLTQFLTSNFNIHIYTFYGRMTALLGNPNFTAGFLALSFVFVGAQIINKKPLLLGSWIVFLASILLTGSRGGLAAFLLGSTLFYFSPKLSLKLLGTTLGLTLLGIILLFFIPIRTSSSFDNRSIIWTKAIAAIGQKPILGWGIENFDAAFSSQLGAGDFDLYKIRVDKAHNELLEIAVGNGIIGVVIWLLLVATAYLRLWKNRDEFEAKIVFITLNVFLVLSIVNVMSIAEYIFFYLSLGIATFSLKSSQKSWRS